MKFLLVDADYLGELIINEFSLQELQDKIREVLGSPEKPPTHLTHLYSEEFLEGIKKLVTWLKNPKIGEYNKDCFLGVVIRIG